MRRTLAIWDGFIGATARLSTNAASVAPFPPWLAVPPASVNLGADKAHYARFLLPLSEAPRAIIRRDIAGLATSAADATMMTIAGDSRGKCSTRLAAPP